MALRVAFVLPDLEGGGSQRVALNLLRGLPREQFAPELVVLQGNGALRGSVAPDAPVHDLQRAKLRLAIPRLLSTLRRRRPDAIFSTFGHVNLALLAIRPLLGYRPRLVIREGNTPSQALSRLRLGRLLAAGYRALYRRADCVICQSLGIAAELREGFKVPADRLVHIPNPVEIAAIRELAEPIQRGGEPGTHFVAAGRLTHQKGFDRLVEMFAALPQTARLVILGEGEEEAALRRKAEDLGVAARIRFPGFDGNPWSVYAGADAFLLPSRWEGMPNAALEALACGAPVIAPPEAGGFAEVVEQVAPGAATLAAPGSDFVAAMLRVQPNPPTRLRPSLLPACFEAGLTLREFARCLAP